MLLCPDLQHLPRRQVEGRCVFLEVTQSVVLTGVVWALLVQHLKAPLEHSADDGKEAVVSHTHDYTLPARLWPNFCDQRHSPSTASAISFSPHSVTFIPPSCILNFACLTACSDHLRLRSRSKLYSIRTMNNVFLPSFSSANIILARPSCLSNLTPPLKAASVVLPAVTLTYPRWPNHTPSRTSQFQSPSGRKTLADLRD